MPRKRRYKPRKDGRYYTLVNTGEYDEYGKPVRIPMYGRTSKELEDKVDALKAQIKTGKYIARRDMSFEEYAETFVSLYKASREYNTQRMYHTILDTYLIPQFGTWLLPDIKRTDIQALINENAGHPRTCQQINIVLKQILSSSVEDHYIQDTPWHRIEMPRYTPPKRRILTPLEEQALNSAALTPEEHLLVMLLFGCGLRLEELLALQVQDIDLAEGELVIHHVIIFKNNQPELKNIPKSPSGFRRIPIPAILTDEVRFYTMRLKKSLPDAGSAFIFSRNGQPYSKSHFYVVWNRIIKAMNAAVATEESPTPISGLTSRVFRYNYATILYYSGITLKKAVELMGHSDEKMILRVYAQLDEEREGTKSKLSGIRPGMERGSRHELIS
mgnify:FL=1